MTQLDILDFQRNRIFYPASYPLSFPSLHKYTVPKLNLKKNIKTIKTIHLVNEPASIKDSKVS